MAYAPDEPLPDIAASESALRRFLHGLPAVDAVGLHQRADELAGRALKGDAKDRAVDTAIGMLDLTTLEGADTPEVVRRLCGRAQHPDPYGAAPPVAAVCVYPDLAETAVTAARESPVRIASVATAFPSGRASREVKLADVRQAVEAGADEVDMVLDRAALLSGRYGRVHEEIRAVKQACGGAHLKVILETGELGTYDAVRRACWLALLAGADFVKTSTGKIAPAATLPVTHVLLQAVRDWHATTGRRCGVKPAGGIRNTKDALRYLVAVREVAGVEWLNPELFRFGASSLLDDLLLQRRTRASRERVRPHYGTKRDVAVD